MSLETENELLRAFEQAQDLLIRKVDELFEKNARLQSVIDGANAQVVRAENAPRVATSDKVLFNGSHGHAGYVIEEQQSQAVAVPEKNLYSTDQYLEVDKSKVPVAYYLPAVPMYHERVTLDEKIARHWSSHMGAKIVEMVPYQSPRTNEQVVAVPDYWREEWNRNVMLMWSCVRKHDSSIPSDVLDFMRESMLAMLSSSQSPRITEQDENLAVLVAQELYSNGGAHESQIDVARRIIGFIASRLPQRVTEQDIIEYLYSVREFINNGVEFGFIRLPEFPDDPANKLLPTTNALLDKLNGVTNAQ